MAPIPWSKTKVPCEEKGRRGIFANHLQIVTRTSALALYTGLTVPVAIVSHIVAEALALHESVLSVAASPLHTYLAVLAAVSLVVASYAAIVSRAELKRLGGLVAHALPFRGQGVEFFAMSAAIQFGFASFTLLGEGSLSAANALVALVAVGVASIIVSALFALLRERLIHIDVTQFAARSFVAVHELRATRVFRFGPYFAYVPSRGNRPPPSSFPVRQ